VTRLETPADVRIPWWVSAPCVAAAAAGAAQGFFASAATPAERYLRCVYTACAFLYLALSTVDFVEHFRLEKEATGRFLSMTAVPFGESVNHALTLSTIALAIVLARPLPALVEPRDMVVLGAPIAFLVLGLRDEIVYHRKRAKHREDIMHTTAHLTAGIMWTTLYALRLTSWS
jgi:hypothetical protein